MNILVYNIKVAVLKFQHPWIIGINSFRDWKPVRKILIKDDCTVEGQNMPSKGLDIVMHATVDAC